MYKFIKILKKDYKILLGIIIGSIITGTSAYAITVVGNTITYDNTNSGLTSTNVQGAIDEVYSKTINLKQRLDKSRNSNIVSVKKYDQVGNSATLCITGEESTCEELAPTTKTTYATGTVVKYKVNSSTTRTFYVLHDDGDKLTLQDRENIASGINWYIEGEEYKGPDRAIETLENLTSGWSNVETQTYTIGITNFNGTNAYTGCDASSERVLSCDRNQNYGCTYTERIAKARLITGQETAA